MIGKKVKIKDNVPHPHAGEEGVIMDVVGNKIAYLIKGTYMIFMVFNRKFFIIK